jgi:hypothetical protein
MTDQVVLIQSECGCFLLYPRRRLYLARQHSTTMFYRIGHQ